MARTVVVTAMSDIRLWLVAVGMLGALMGELVSVDPANAQGAPPKHEVTVGLYLSPPFVTQDKRAYTGMAFDLWTALAQELSLKSNYRIFPTVPALQDAASTGDIDIAVTNLSITEDRALRVDFTYPWFDAGLRIMVRDQQGTGLREILGGLRDTGYLRAYLWIAVLLGLATILLTVFDRQFDPAFPARWRGGLAESFYAVMSLVSGRSPVRRNMFGWAGRIMGAAWLVFGIAVVAFVTSSVTSVMTTLSLANQIHGLSDLPGKPVGVLIGSVAEDFARREGLDLRSFANIEDSVKALRDGSVDALVADAPVLEFFAHTHPEQETAVVGGIFQPDKYGFALPRNSDLTRQLTVKLIGAHEDGVVEALHDRYFGKAP